MFLGNASIQSQAFMELDFFIDSLDAKVNSHRVVKAIFHNHEANMRLVPHTLCEKMVEKICKSDPDERAFSDLYLLKAITYVEDKGIKENQIEIVRLFTAPGTSSSSPPSSLSHHQHHH